ncbi:hypothetical protein H6784_00100 [Candidatus Nomurabacteria bacterium]|nr:hypothetical protein [Candidatus Kaiserbacteria bacterium]MCB9813794.1 hypothetical protein [Candidatus Nomurabacteria bacterium]
MKYLKFLGLSTVVIAIFAYFLIFYVPASDKKEDVSQADDKQALSQVEKTKAKEPFSGAGTMDSLKLLGEDLECSISYVPTEGEKEVEGTYFVSEGKIRGDFLVPSPDLEGTILSSMIMDQTYFYSWTEIDDQMYGAKVAIVDMKKDENNTSQSVTLDTEVKYNCKLWENVDDSVFLPPSTVLFRDMNETMKAGMEYGTTYEEGAELPF